jgi:hypothetical protein
MTFGNGIDATDSACKNHRCGTDICSHANAPAVTMMIDRSSPRS